MASSFNLAMLRRRASAPGETEDTSAILDALPLAVAVLDSEGVIRSVNAAWKRLEPPDFSPGIAYCLACESIFELDAEGLAGLESGIRNVIAGHREGFSAEYRVRSGAAVTRVDVAPLRGDDFRGAVVTHCPSSAGEEESEQHRQREKIEAVGRLVGGVAHDFANLLTLISGYSEIVLNRLGLGEPLRVELEEIRKAAQRGSRLTSQILNFTRGQALEPRVLDLNLLLAEMEAMLRPIIGEYIQLRVERDPALGKINADPGQMEQVIMNLVLNARDAMPRGGVITVQTSNVELSESDVAVHLLAPGRYVMLTFTDTGVGMDAQTLARLFEPFFTTKDKGRGTGLGLTTVYGIVKQYGGDIRARSTLGAGTTFSLLLPRTGAVAAGAETGHPPPAPCRGAETILLVEDEESVRRLLRHVLTRQGYTVLEAADGPTALEMLAAHAGAVRLLLTDMVMPHMSGRELAERGLAMLPGLKVVYMSGYTNDVLLRTGALGPGMSFLQKPLRPETLAAKVREVLDARPA